MGAKRPKTPREAATDRLDLDSPFERLTALASAMFGASHAMIGVLDEDRTLFRASIGLGRSEMPRGLTATNLVAAMGPDAVLVIEDALADERVRDHPMVTGEPRLRFFAGASVVNAAGEVVGAIGVMDIKARPKPDDAELENLKLLARMAGEILDRAEAIRQQAEQLELLRLAEEMTGVGQWRYQIEPHAITWSDAVYRIHGVTRETFDPSAGGILATYHPDDEPVFRGLLDRAISTGEGYEFKLRLFRPDGEERTVTAKAETERDDRGRVTALFGVFQDVTEAERAIDLIQSSEARYRLLAEHSSDIITMTGVDGIFTYVSPVIETALGYRPEDLVGRFYADFVHPDDVLSIKAAYAAYVAAGPGAPSPRVVWRTLKKNGELVWFEGHPRLIWDANGRPVEIQDLLRDITDTKRLEAELLEARDRAHDAARAKSEFLANMSHELRTPLTSVVGFSGLLQQSPTLGETERRYADRIGTASEALLGVINDILDYSKLEAGAVEMEDRDFSPRAMAEAAAALVEGQCAVKGLTLAIELDPGLPEALTGDEGRLRQVTLNFLANAVKFTGAGRVTLEASWAAERLRVAVTDTGIGVAAEKIDALFERFSQADNSTTRVYGGTGLGLSISRRLVEMMGGEIGADSRSGEGSTFWFEVPLRPAEALVSEKGVDDEAAYLDGLRILVADDAAANRELVGAILGGLGVAFETVEDGAEAVEAARSGGYDLILMDVHMPVMDGLDATRAIRAFDGPAGQVPIIALTANVQPEQMLRCREAGMDDHVGKPIQVAELLRVISARLEQRAGLKTADAA
ncbi:PAS domain S-box protein [Brevundimonas sp.]|uniref:PAS domain S-box protein n=1 Tax=Brevundimonas sp. TaxID=1871086 RepID=UPI0027312F91|nr:PAS domain S-box protein [Brevundimonas sp.]MDP1914054.1 PAS domain S-box protein [Brevundimonas sp.]